MKSAATLTARTILFPALAASLVLAPGLAPAPAANAEPPPPHEQAATTTVFLVRHAEKSAPGDPEFDPQTPQNPPLNAAGRARAADLARTLEEARVTAIFAS